MKKILGLIILTGTASILQAGYYDGNQSECVYQQGSHQNGYRKQNQFAQNNQDRYQQNGVNTNGSSEEQNQKLSREIQDSIQNYFFKKYNNVVVYVYEKYMNIQSYFSNKYNNVTVQVNNGNVTLQGSVATQEDKTALEQQVRKIHGVRDVTNNVTIENNSESK